MTKKRNICYVNFVYVIFIVNTISIYGINKKIIDFYANKPISINKAFKPSSLINDINSLPKNRVVPLVNDGINFSSLSVNTSENCAILIGCNNDWTGEGLNVIDDDLLNYSTSNILLNDIDKLSVTYPSENIPAGTYAGFRISSNSLLGLLDNLVINTKDESGVIVESYPLSNNALFKTLDFSGPINIGFVTTKTFKTIEISVQGILSSLNVYYPFIKIYQENSIPFPCNEITLIKNSSYPIEIDDVGVTGINLGLLGNTIVNPDYIIDENEGNYAILNGGLINVGVLSSSYISIKKQKDYLTGNVTPFLSGTYAGFNITSSNILNLNVLGNIKISTYLNNVFQEDNSIHNNLINIPLSETTTQNIGFVTTKVYDEIKITVYQPIGVSLGEIKVNFPIIKNYCSDTSLNCNEKIAWTNTEHPIEISTVNSVGLVSIGGAVKNVDNIINSNTNDYAEIGLNIGVASQLQIGVYDVIKDYSSPHYVGFEIESTSLLDLNLLNNISVLTYLNGVATGDNVNGENILLSAPLLTSTNKQSIGFVTTKLFDEVRIQFNTLVGSNLGTIKIYNSVIQKMCSKELTCSENYNLNSPEFSTYIDYSKTGISGLVCLGCEVSNTDAILTNNTSDFASINITAGIAASASITVRDATNVFPSNSYAGFVIKSNSSAIELSLFESIVIETIDENGNTIETSSGNDLLDLTVLLRLTNNTPNGFLNLGFNTTQPYSGLKITINKLIDVNTNLNLTQNNEIDIYNAFVNTTGATGVGFQFCLDSDNDTVLDVLDLDDDNDGIPDSQENNNSNSVLDDDNDGILNYEDSDTSGFIDTNLDGVDDRYDFDLDGIIDQQDTDADGDGCSDALEADGSFDLDDLVGNSLGNNVSLINGIPIVNGIPVLQNITSAVKNTLNKIGCFIDLSLRKTVNTAIVNVGETVVFSIKVSNDGGLIAKDVLIENTLADGLVYQESESIIPLNTTYDENTGIWDLTNVEIKQGEKITLKIAAKITVSGAFKVSKAEVLSFRSSVLDIDSLFRY